MKIRKISQMWLLALGMTISGVGVTLYSHNADAMTAGKEPNELECSDKDGNVVSYGASCSSGTGKCTSNDCPKGTTGGAGN